MATAIAGSDIANSVMAANIAGILAKFLFIDFKNPPFHGVLNMYVILRFLVKKLSVFWRFKSNYHLLPANYD